jgi:hypothetical protein
MLTTHGTGQSFRGTLCLHLYLYFFRTFERLFPRITFFPFRENRNRSPEMSQMWEPPNPGLIVSEDDTNLLSSDDTGNDSNEEERIEITSLETEAFPLNTQIAETSNQIRDLLLLLRTQVDQLEVPRENLDVEADIAQVGPQMLNRNHHRTQEEYLLEARSRHDGTHRPHAPKLQSRYY